MRLASGPRCSLRFPRRAAILVLLSVMVSCPACSSGRKPVFPVKGQLLVNGKPAANAQILFHPVNGTQDDLRPTGHTDDEGFFTLTSYVNGDGAAEGDYNVTATWFRVYRADNRADGEVLRYNALPKQYSQPTLSPLRATVSKGANELTAFQLSVN